MAIDTFEFITISGDQTDPDSPLDTVLMTALRDNHEFLMRWLGRDFLAGAVANHDHDGLNSKKVTTADLAGDAGDVPGFDAAVQGVSGFGGGSMSANGQISGSTASANFQEVVLVVTGIANTGATAAVLSVVAAYDQVTSDQARTVLNLTFTRSNADATWAVTGNAYFHKLGGTFAEDNDADVLGANLSASSASFVNFDIPVTGNPRIQIKRDSDDQVTLRITDTIGSTRSYKIAVNGYVFS